MTKTPEHPTPPENLDGLTEVDEIAGAVLVEYPDPLDGWEGYYTDGEGGDVLGWLFDGTILSVDTGGDPKGKDTGKAKGGGAPRKRAKRGAPKKGDAVVYHFQARGQQRMQAPAKVVAVTKDGLDLEVDCMGNGNTRTVSKVQEGTGEPHTWSRPPAKG